LRNNDRSTNSTRRVKVAVYVVFAVMGTFIMSQTWGLSGSARPFSGAQRASDPVADALTHLNAADDEIADLTSAITTASKSTSLDPLLLVAVMYTESRFDHKAVSKKRYKGLMQTPWASMKYKDVDTLYGARILKDKLRVAGDDLHLALSLYKGGRNKTAERQATETLEVYQEIQKFRKQQT
jgi:soluble lytic murein transglycosylase-like protein